ncbi:MAG: hypothetical protein PVH84_13510, partial [Candidatus Aminicenantes bacterium]
MRTTKRGLAKMGAAAGWRQPQNGDRLVFPLGKRCLSPIQYGLMYGSVLRSGPPNQNGYRHLIPKWNFGASPHFDSGASPHFDNGASPHFDNGV